MVLISVSMAGILNEIEQKTYVCSNEPIPLLAAALLPLAAFVPEPKKITDYCNK